MELTLVRHGQSTANRDGLLQGRFDAPLSDLGQRQASQLGDWFAQRAMEWDAAYCSPLSRARDTARIITERLGRTGDIAAERGARVLRVEHPSFYARALDGLGDYAEFGGEAYDDVQQRVRRFIELIVARHRTPAARVLVVSHGGLMFHLTKMLICQPVPRVMLIKFGNCSVTRLNLRERRGAYMGEIEWHLPLDLIGGEPSGGAGSLLY